MVTEEQRKLSAYLAQQANAKRRGIGWELTFKQWCEWWGDDFAKRGRGHDQLCMQRPADSGSYRLGNIYKGSPRENGITRGHGVRNRRQDALRADSWMMDVKPPDEYDYSDDEFELRKLGYPEKCSWVP